MFPTLVSDTASVRSDTGSLSRSVSSLGLQKARSQATASATIIYQIVKPSPEVEEVRRRFPPPDKFRWGWAHLVVNARPCTHAVVSHAGAPPQRMSNSVLLPVVVCRCGAV